MANRKNIEHPLDGALITSSSFAAYGYVDANKKTVRIALLDQQNNPAGNICLLRRADHDDGGFWSWLVSDVSKGSYTLQLRNANDESVIESIKLNVQPSFGTGITFPGNNAQVTPSFTAYGTTDKSSITATMSQPGSNPVSQPATINNGAWHALFYSLTPGNKWTLTADDGSASPPTSTPITVT